MAKSYTAFTKPTTQAPTRHAEVQWTKVETAPNGTEKWLVTISDHAAPQLERILQESAQVLHWEPRP